MGDLSRDETVNVRDEAAVFRYGPAAGCGRAMV